MVFFNQETLVRLAYYESADSSTAGLLAESRLKNRKRRSSFLAAFLTTGAAQLAVYMRNISKSRLSRFDTCMVA